MNILSPSILAADFAVLGEQIKSIEKGGAQYLHIDVADGVFVPSITFGMCVEESLRKVTELIFDVHLMITEPVRYIEAFAKAGAQIITVHIEACSDVKETLTMIHGNGCKAGLSIKPGTPVEALLPYMPYVDMILLMCVEPGFGGQKYIETSTDRIRRIREMIRESDREIDLEVDGGINAENVSEILDAGANVIVAGSAVFRGDILKNTRTFMDLLA